MSTYLKPKKGRYGEFGGVYMPEILMAPMIEMTQHWKETWKDQHFKNQFYDILNHYAGRPTPLTEVQRFAAAIKAPKIYLKREDLLHTGAHKLNNAIGQCLFAKRYGKKRIIAETGAGQHGVATAAACAYFGLPCVIYMGRVDMQRQSPNVARMKLMGAEVIGVDSGSKTLKDAVNEALRDWSESFTNTHYCLGSALGPHPYPDMVATFQKIIGKETKAQCIKQIGRNPNIIVACVGGGSNAIGIFSAFLDDTDVKLIGVEAGGHGMQIGEHAARFRSLSTGVLQGSYTYLLQNKEGQIAETASISAGLDYPAVGPQHAQLYKQGRATYTAASDQEAVEALKILARTEGIICALESAHALAYVIKIAHQLDKNDVIVVNLSGRGDKDLPQLMEKNLL